MGLEVDLLHARTLRWPAVAESAARHVDFIEAAYDQPTRKFRSARALDGTFADAVAAPEAAGRALLALARTMTQTGDPELAARAGTLFDLTLPAVARLASPRAQAFVVLACAAAPATADRTLVLRTLGTNLHALVRSFAQPGWPWPEREMTGESALLPRAMIVAGQRLGAATMLAVGLQVLDWLIDAQTAEAGHLSPVGSAGWTRGEPKPRFDQRPIDVTALLLAARAAFGATAKPRYAEAAERAYAWFQGSNDLGLKLADPVRGACRDGLAADGLIGDPDGSEGAEATLAWLIAVEQIRSLRANAVTDAKALVARQAVAAEALASGSAPVARSTRPDPVAQQAR